MTNQEENILSLISESNLSQAVVLNTLRNWVSLNGSQYTANEVAYELSIYLGQEQLTEV